MWRMRYQFRGAGSRTAWLYSWLQANRAILINAGSLACTTAVNAMLGFAFWWMAARQFPPASVGLASAAISAMLLLANIGVLGMGSLLIGELPRRAGRETSLISPALILVGAACGLVGIIFACVAPLVSANFQPFSASFATIALFATGVSFTSIRIVLDQSLFGLLRGDLQFWRNLFFGAAKLAALFVLSLWLAQRAGASIYAAWTLANILSLAFLVALKGGWQRTIAQPDWGLLRKLGKPALQHYMLNLILQAPGMVLPMLVTFMLSTASSAWFYISWMIAGFLLVASYALTSALYAINSSASAVLARKIRLTLALSLLTSIAGIGVLEIGSSQILALFGYSYITHAGWSLRILALAALPMIVRYHYIVVYRMQGRMARAVLPIAAGGLLELLLAALGAHLGGLSGLSLGWLMALCIEAICMLSPLYRVAYPLNLAQGWEHPWRYGTLRGRAAAIAAWRRLAARFRLDEKTRLLDGVVAIVLPLAAFVLWIISLKIIDIRQMNDLGLVSILPPATIIALAIVTVSFCLNVWRAEKREYVLILHLVLLIFMLFGMTTLVEQAPRFSTVYRHAGYTDFILRTGSVDPYLDAYFNWPSFFIVSAFLTKVAGYNTILSYAVWAPVFFNLIYFGPLYMIFTSATDDRPTIWLSICFFYLANWIGQDYFSPQGLNFFLYLVIIAILLRWFKTPPTAQPRYSLQRWGRLLGPCLPPAQWLLNWLSAPDERSSASQPRQRRALLAGIIVIFAFMVASHPLTPFFTLLSVAALVICRRVTQAWLPLLMGAMIAAWLCFMAQPYLAGHLAGMLADLGNLQGSIAANVTSRVTQGNPQHEFITTMCVVMTGLIWLLAGAGCLWRLRRGYRDASFVCLATVSFPLLLVQSYGGEMLLRIYLFTLPPMVFFAAVLLTSAFSKGTVLLRMGAMIGISLALLGGSLFTHYGNERMDYVTYAELNGIRHLYSIAPRGSLLLAGWEGIPWEFENYEQYNQEPLDQVLPLNAVANADVSSVVRFILSNPSPRTYVIFTRTESATADSEGLPRGTLGRLERALLASREFRLIYSNPDAQILLYAGKIQGATP